MSDINELFNRDPLKLTDDDIDKIIEEYRKKRAQFKAMPASSTPKKLTDKQEAVKKKLGDLGGFKL